MGVTRFCDRQDKMQMTVCADPIDAKQRIKLNRAPQNQNEEALKDELKGMGFTWSGFGENGKWTGDKTCVDIWKDSTWRARVKLCCSAISFYGPGGEDMAMHDYISAVEAFDNTALDDDLSSLGKSIVPPTFQSSPDTANNTPKKRGRS